MLASIRFNSYASSYDIKGELYYLKNAEGVQSVKLFQRVSGESQQYLIEITVDDEAATDVEERLKSAGQRYAGNISDVEVSVYREV